MSMRKVGQERRAGRVPWMRKPSTGNRDLVVITKEGEQLIAASPIFIPRMPSEYQRGISTRLQCHGFVDSFKAISIHTLALAVLLSTHILALAALLHSFPLVQCCRATHRVVNSWDGQDSASSKEDQ